MPETADDAFVAPVIVHVNEDVEQLSLMLAFGTMTDAVVNPKSAGWTMFAGHVITGNSESVTVILKLQVVTLLQLSVAV